MASEIPADIRATAKAVRDKLCIDCECTFDQGCGCLDALHEALLAERQAQQTRAVAILSGIEAMRLPSGASSVAGGLAIEESMFACEDTVFHGAAKCWNAMIDEAISDG